MTPTYEYSTTGCMPKGNGKFGFDVNLDVKVQMDLRKGACNQPSREEPGKTVCQHERGHAQDYKEFYESCDAKVPTEGFSSLDECQKALEGFAKAMEKFAEDADRFSGKRDGL